MVAAFEAQNTCRITLSGSLQLHRGYLDMEWRAQAMSSASEAPEAYSLVLANASVWAGDFKTLMGLLTRLLYALDFALAEREFNRVAQRAETPPAH